MTNQAIIVGSLLVKPKNVNLMTLDTVPMLLLNMRIMANNAFRIGVSTIRKRHTQRLHIMTF